MGLTSHLMHLKSYSIGGPRVIDEVGPTARVWPYNINAIKIITACIIFNIIFNHRLFVNVSIITNYHHPKNVGLR